MPVTNTSLAKTAARAIRRAQIEFYCCLGQGRELLQQGKAEKAYHQFSEARRIKPDDRAILAGIAECLRIDLAAAYEHEGNHRLAQAEQIYQRLVRTHQSRRAEAALIVIQSWRLISNRSITVEAGLSEIRRAISIEVGCYTTIFAVACRLRPFISRTDFNNFIDLARLAYRTNQQSANQRGSLSAPSHPSRALLLLDSHFQFSRRAEVALKEGKVEDAALEYWHLLQLDPMNDQARQGLNRCLGLLLVQPGTRLPIILWICKLLHLELTPKDSDLLLVYRDDAARAKSGPAIDKPGVRLSLGSDHQMTGLEVKGRRQTIEAIGRAVTRIKEIEQQISEQCKSEVEFTPPQNRKELCQLIGIGLGQLHILEKRQMVLPFGARPLTDALASLEKLCYGRRLTNMPREQEQLIEQLKAAYKRLVEKLVDGGKRDLGQNPISITELAGEVNLSVCKVERTFNSDPNVINELSEGDSAFLYLHKSINQLNLEMRRRRLRWAIDHAKEKGFVYHSISDFARERLGVLPARFRLWQKEDPEINNIIAKEILKGQVFQLNAKSIASLERLRPDLFESKTASKLANAA